MLQIDYQEFEKCFYAEHEEITALSIHQMLDIRKKLSIKVVFLTSNAYAKLYTVASLLLILLIGKWSRP